jgi:gamma-glutamylcyclotransferase (GGCT)/AIG2-like uncharacterized protein YtfP
MDSLPTQTTRFFVYGTLRLGEERARYWPRTPLSIELATTRGTLHDLGPYPAMVAGEGLIRGELWTLALDDVPLTLRALDEVEGYNQGGVDWYIRRIVDCQTADGRPHLAYAYFWGGQPDISHMPLIPPGPDGACDWKAYKQLPK